MPLKPGKSRAVISANIGEMLHKYKRSGTIGNTHPASMTQARQIASAAALTNAGRSQKHKGRRRKGVKRP